jgi:hypothetical protein
MSEHCHACLNLKPVMFKFKSIVLCSDCYLELREILKVQVDQYLEPERTVEG